MSVGIVIPIRDLERDFETIALNLGNCIKYEIHAWLVFDSKQATHSKEWEELRNTFKNDLFSFTYGNFNSPGLARNSALNNLDVDWIGFCDSDDLMNMQELSEVSNYGQENNLDIVVANLEVQDKHSQLSSKTHGISSNISIPLSLCIFPAFTRIVYRVSFIKDLSFPEFKLGEDQCFLFEVLCNSPRIGYFDKTIYLYFRNVAGQLTSKNDNSLEILKSIRQIKLINTRYKMQNNLLAAIIEMRLRITFFKMTDYKSKYWIRELFFSILNFFKQPANNFRAATYIVNHRRRLN